MYRIIGIIALVGTLTGCPSPTQQPGSKTFEAEYKIILQSGPFRGPLEIAHPGGNSVTDDSMLIKDEMDLPRSWKVRATSYLIEGKYRTSMDLAYSRPLGSRDLGQETVYRLEIWTDGTLKGTRTVRIDDSEDKKIVIRDLTVEI